MRRSFHRQTGSSLLEMLLVALVVGLIAAAVLPKFINFQKFGQSAEEDFDPADSRQGMNLNEILALYTTDQDELTGSRGVLLSTEEDGRSQAGRSQAGRSQAGRSQASRDSDRNAGGQDYDRESYDDLVGELKKRNMLGEWKKLLESKFSPDHQLLVALRPKKSAATEPRSTGPEPGRPDPELTWADGKPVRVFD